ncbi:MAG: redoxin domain-containing protein [Gemmataceae bacterium]
MLSILAVLSVALVDPGTPKPPIGVKLVETSLTQPATGKLASLLEAAGENPKAVLVFFLDSSCPVCQNYLVGIEKLAKSKADAGLRVVGVNSRVTDSPKVILQHSKTMGLSFPVLQDPHGKLAAKLGIDRVPCALVLDEGFTVRYRGRVDDQHTPGVSRAKPSTHELKDAVEAVLAKEQVKTPWTATSGCLLTPESIEKKSTGTITWSNRIASIVQNRCQECHRPGEAGPFSLLNHEDALGWAPMIREVIDNGRMPPWHADAPRGYFSNDRRLTDDERKDLLAWLDDGCPRGNPAEDPAPRQFVEGWRIGQPDRIITMNTEVKVPAQFG